MICKVYQVTREAFLLILISIALNYGIYRLLTAISIKRKYILWMGIAVNLIVLAYFKYYNFFVDNLNLLFDAGLSIRNIILPLGISFITFQQIAFLVDAYRQETPEYSFLDYAFFVFYFPHVASGPIILHSDFFPLTEAKKEMNWDRWHMTLTRFFTKYLYIPLGGNRKGRMRTYINTLIFFMQRLLAWNKLDVYYLGRAAWVFYGIYQAI